MRIAAAVILYHPTESALTNMDTYQDYVQKVFVFDNSEKETAIRQMVQQKNNIEYHQDFENKGIATRLNQACEKAIDEGYDWLLTMDQDSFFSPDSLAFYLKCFSEYSAKEKVAVFGTRYQRQHKTSLPVCAARETLNLITSGMLVNLKHFKDLGGFDEALFIDSVDHDYIIRAKKRDLSAIEFSNIFILHQLGTLVYRSSIKTLYLVKKTKVVHSPLRCYYIYRNMLYLQKKFENDLNLLQGLKKITRHHIRNCFFYGRDTISLMRYLLAAKRDFNEGRMGKIEVKY
jgi:rhamnosyltransferase